MAYRVYLLSIFEYSTGAAGHELFHELQFNQMPTPNQDPDLGARDTNKCDVRVLTICLHPTFG